MHVIWSKHAENFKAHDNCPYLKGSLEYDKAMEGPPVRPADIGLAMVHDCVPSGRKTGFGWAFPSDSDTPTVNLEVLWADLAWFFSRLCFGRDKFKTVDFKEPWKVVENKGLSLLGDSRTGNAPLEHFNKQHVKMFWAKLITHLAWMITMNKNFFHKKDQVVKHGKMDDKVLKVVRSNAEIILTFLRSCVVGGHNGYFFKEIFADCCWPVLEEDLMCFRHNDVLAAYESAYQSWDRQLASFKFGLCCTYQSKLNTRYWNSIRGGNNKRAAWIFELALYSLFDDSCQIKSCTQFYAMDVQYSLRGSYNNLTKWFHQEDWESCLQRLYSVDDESKLTPQQKTELADKIELKYRHVRNCYVSDEDVIDPTQSFPKVNKQTGDTRYFLFGKSPRGWTGFIQRCGKVIPRVRWIMAEEQKFTDVEMQAHSDVWLEARSTPETPQKRAARQPQPAAADGDDDGSDSDDSFFC